MTNFFPVWFILGSSSILTRILLPSALALSVVHASQAKDVETQRTAWTAAVRAANARDFKVAVEKTDEAVAAGLTTPMIFYHRGRWHFRLGNMTESLRDFDEYVQRAPQRANAQWERGITCYYAEEYKAGAKQFADYQEYHDNDVENAVWRYLCQIQYDGKEKARKAILPIKNDTRVPMMEIYKLFRGESNPEKVLRVLGASNATEEQAKHEAFDAHLYLALFYDSENDLKAARKHVDNAVKQFEKGDYMWAVAVQHQKRLAKRVKRKTDKNE